MNPLTLAVSKVIIENRGSATGFFYKRGDDIFFITNKHVVLNEGGYNNLTIYPNFIISNNNIYTGCSFTIPALLHLVDLYHCTVGVHHCSLGGSDGKTGRQAMC